MINVVIEKHYFSILDIRFVVIKKFLPNIKRFCLTQVGALEQIHKEQENQQNGTPLVWVHDYHLMLASNWIRQAADEKNLRLKLGFFLHIPFPPWDIFRLFPWADEILQGMLGE